MKKWQQPLDDETKAYLAAVFDRLKKEFQVRESEARSFLARKKVWNIR